MVEIYNFPGGKKQSVPMQPWIGPVNATVHFVGVRQRLVAGRDGVVTQEPYFLVHIYNGVPEDKTLSCFSIEVEGVYGLHATLNLLVDGAHTRNQGFSIYDYSNGETGMPDEYRAFLTEE